jgi:arylsulfatase A-like enzyme
MDVLPTLAGITGTTLPTKKIDGVDFISLLKNQPDANPRDNLLYYHNTNNLEAVRKDNWKLVLPHPTRSYVGVSSGKDGSPGEYAKLVMGLELYVACFQ